MGCKLHKPDAGKAIALYPKFQGAGSGIYYHGFAIFTTDIPPSFSPDREATIYPDTNYYRLFYH